MPVLPADDKRLDEWVDEDRVLGLADTTQAALVSVPSLGMCVIPSCRVSVCPP